MIRTYSDKLIALSKIMTQRNGVPVAIVKAEADINGSPKEVEITFYGKKAEEAREAIVPGAQFTFRGFVGVDDDGQLTMVAATFAVIA